MSNIGRAFLLAAFLACIGAERPAETRPTTRPSDAPAPATRPADAEGYGYLRFRPPAGWRREVKRFKVYLEPPDSSGEHRCLLVVDAPVPAPDAIDRFFDSWFISPFGAPAKPLSPRITRLDGGGRRAYVKERYHRGKDKPYGDAAMAMYDVNGVVQWVGGQATDADLWRKYEPEIDKFFESIEVDRAELAKYEPPPKRKR